MMQPEMSEAAEIVNLSRVDNTSWGFRVTGGLDFGTPVTVVKVTAGSLAELAGLHVGDIVLTANGQQLAHFTHDEAYKFLHEAGNFIELSVVRGSLVLPPLASEEELAHVRAAEEAQAKAEADAIKTAEIEAQGPVDPLTVLKPPPPPKSPSMFETIFGPLEEPPAEKRKSAFDELVEELVQQQGGHTQAQQLQQLQEREQVQIPPESQLQPFEQVEILPEYQTQQQLEVVQESQFPQGQQMEILPEAQFQQEPGQQEQQMQVPQLPQLPQQEQAENLPQALIHQQSGQPSEIIEGQIQQQATADPNVKASKSAAAPFMKRRLTAGDIVIFLAETAGDQKATAAAAEIVKAAIRAASGIAPLTPEEKRKQEQMKLITEQETNENALTSLENVENPEQIGDGQILSEGEVPTSEMQEISAEQQVSSEEQNLTEATSEDALLQQAYMEPEDKLAMIQKQLEALQQLPLVLQEQLSSLLQEINEMVAQKLAEINPLVTQEEYAEAHNEENNAQTQEELQKNETDEAEKATHEDEVGYQQKEEGEAGPGAERKEEDDHAEQVYAEGSVITTEAQEHESQSQPQEVEVAENSQEMSKEDRKRDIKWQHEKPEGNKRLFPLPPPPKPFVLPRKLKLEMCVPPSAFTDEFIAETLTGNAEIIAGKTIGVNFQKWAPPVPNYDHLKSSSVLQLIKDREHEKSAQLAEELQSQDGAQTQKPNEEPVAALEHKPVS